MDAVKISIIIPVYNSAATIRACLDAISIQSYSPDSYEIIVVDNGSKDDTVKIATDYPVTILSKPDGTISSVRNFGASNANGEILAFIDSDCVVGVDWLNEVVKAIKPSNVGAAGSGYLTPINYTWVEKAWLLELEGSPFFTESLPGGNTAVKTNVFSEIGGFDEDLTTSEDWDLCARIVEAGYDIVYSPAIKNVHLGNSKSIKQLVAKEYWYGKNILDHAKKNPFDTVFMASILFIISSLIMFVGIPYVIYVSKIEYILVLASPLLLLLATASYMRIKRSKKYYYFAHLMLIYLFYLAARSAALLNSISKRLINRIE